MKPTKQCGSCKEIKNISEYRKDKTKKDGLHTTCRDCGVNSERSWKETVHGRAKTLIKQARTRCRKTSGTVSLTDQWVMDALNEGVCQATGLPFDLTMLRQGHGYANPYGPSLDRIDSSNRDYSPENTQVVVNAYNVAMSNWDNENIVIAIANGIKARRRKESK